MTKAERLEAEIKRTELMKEFDREYKIYGTICGIDEAGRGPLCGPVVAAAVILPDEYNILYINDSKKLSETKREEVYKEIDKYAVAYGVGIVLFFYFFIVFISFYINFFFSLCHWFHLLHCLSNDI